MPDRAKACCCGHMQWEHRDNGASSCRVCGGISCAQFHSIGEGHGRAFEIVVIVLVLLAMAGIWKLTHPTPTYDSCPKDNTVFCGDGSHLTGISPSSAYR